MESDSGFDCCHRNCDGIKLLPDINKRQPYPLNWDEQQQLFSALPPHLAEMALFAVNTGCRDAEICNLQWDREVKVPQLETFVFIVPGQFVKNGDDRLVVLNDIACSLVNSRLTHSRWNCGPPTFDRRGGAPFGYPAH